MAGSEKPRKIRVLDCPLLQAAATPLPPRCECCVFGCRSSDRDPVEFRPLPDQPDSLRQWLVLINRLDLLDKPGARRGARVCALHFPPDGAAPTLLLPSCGEQLDLSPSSIEVKQEEDGAIEIKFEPEPTEETSPSSHNQPVTDPLQLPEAYDQDLGQTFGQTLDQEPTQYQSPILRQSLLHVKPEPTYFDFQVNSEAQTNATEALYRQATFSAVEVLSIPPTRPQVDVKSRSIDVQTTDDLIEVFTKDIRRKYGLELEELEKKLEILEKPQMEKMWFLKGCNKFLDEKIAGFVKSHAYLVGKYNGKYPERFKLFALKLFLWNPKAYKFVEAFFELPSKSNIERFIVPVGCGLGKDLMEALKVKTGQLSASGKMCVVCFDVLPLNRNVYYDVGNDYLCGFQDIDKVVQQRPAEYAAVISARGLYAKWKQPVSFALVAEKSEYLELKEWLNSTIGSLFDIGLNVKAFVTNSAEEFLSVEPYFEVNERGIYHLYDVPDLFMSARDEIMQYDVHINDTVAKWEHILQVYEQDKELGLPLMPKITENHIRPDSRDVKLATQLFSSSVAAALYYHAVRLRNKDIKNTAEFMKKMSELFDVLYSRKLDNAYRATGAQQRFLKDTLRYLQNLKVKDKHGNIIESKFVTGLCVTIKSMMSLMTHLKKCNLNYLLTKNLSKDFMETQFKEMKRLCRSDEPTPIKFTRAFRRLYLSSILNNSKTTATGDDIMMTLSKIGQYVTDELEREKIPEQNTRLTIGVADYKILWPSNEYISGYILWKCLERHCCEKLEHYLCDYYLFESQRKLELLEVFQFYNAENVKKVCKLRPPLNIRKYIDFMETKFNEYYNSPDVRSLCFGWNLYSHIKTFTFDVPCPCFPLDFFIMLYIRLKIFSTVKEIKQIMN